MNFIKKNRPLLIAVIIEILLLSLTARDFFLPRFSYDMTGTDIPSNASYENNIPYTNENIGEPGFFTYGPGITLPRGVYRVIVDYSCTDIGNTIFCMGANTTFNSLEYDDIKLDPNKNSITFTLWVNKNVNDFQLTSIFGGSGELRVSRVFIAESYASSTLAALYIIVFGIFINLLIVGISYYKRTELSNTTILNVMTLIGIILFSSAPIFAGYMTNGHDLTFHLLRIEGIKEGLLGGQFPVKIQPPQLNGYGYAASVFYGDVFLYIPALLQIAGLSIQDSYLWFIFVINTATVLVCYYSMKGFFKSNGLVLLGTILYCLSPYRLLNIYGRAAVGEYTAMIFFPLLALSLYRIFTQDCTQKSYAKNWILPVIAYTGIIESHILSCEIVGIFTIIVCIIYIRKVFIKERFFMLCKVAIMTILVNLGFLIPFIDYMCKKNCLISWGVMTNSGIQQNGLFTARLFTFFLNGDGMPQAKSAFRQFGMQGEMGISIGFAALVCFFVFLYFMLIKQKQKPASYRLGVFAWATAGITILLSLDFFPWDFLDDYLGSLVTSLQFPWRLLGLGACALAIVGCCAIQFIHQNYGETYSRIFMIIVLICAIIVPAYLLDDLLLDNPPYRIYSENALPTDGSGSSFNEYAPSGYDWDSLVEGYVVSSPSLVVENYQKNYTTITANISNTSESLEKIQLPLFYFPGYTVKSNTKPLFCYPTETDLIQLDIPPGYTGNIKIYFKQPAYWIVSEIISFISIIYIAYVIFFKNKKRI